MCTTQAIFGLPFEFIQSNLDDGLFLSELSIKNKHSKKIIFDIRISEDNLTFKIKKNLGFLDLMIQVKMRPFILYL